MTIHPIIPIWLMVVLCLGMIALIVIKQKKVVSIVRRIGIVLMLFMVNLQMVIPGNSPELKIHSSDAHVLFVIDDTLSMLARDYNFTEEDRLSAAKRDLEHLSDGLLGAKQALLSFHNTCNIMSPYTDNGSHITSVIRSVYPLQYTYARGTSMNIAKEMMLTMLKQTYKDDNKKTIVFFISDGEINNGDTLDSFAELKQYISGGAVLGYGSATGGKMVVKEFYDDDEFTITDDNGNPALSKIDEGNLRSLANDMGIQYINMNTGASLDSLIDQLVVANNITFDLDMSVEVEGEYTDDTPIYWIFVLVLVALVVWEYVMIRRRRNS